MSRRSSALLALLLLISPALSLAATAPEVIAKSIETFYKERPTIRAQFVQRVQKPGRRRILEKSGNVFFSRPGKMRWEYKSPETVFYVSDGKVLWSYQVEDKLVTRLDVGSSELYHQSRYLFGQGNLVEDFTLSAGPARADGLYALVLTPKQNARDFKSLTLFVTADTGEIRETVLVDPYDNQSTIEFVKVDFKTVDEAIFTFTPPTDATVRDLSKETQK
jgi:outer membrane lipoprotein carrier protein